MCIQAVLEVEKYVEQACITYNITLGLTVQPAKTFGSNVKYDSVIF